eukprot:m.95535 g.95535  ORF g.95535 m.95535 type:complete len:95 (-) comp21927_c0_seq2:1329-1613(-)
MVARLGGMCFVDRNSFWSIDSEGTTHHCVFVWCVCVSLCVCVSVDVCACAAKWRSFSSETSALSLRGISPLPQLQPNCVSSWVLKKRFFVFSFS